MRSLITTIVLLLALNLISEARPGREAQIPNGTKINCLNCHVSQYGGIRNPFGQTVEQMGLSGGNVVWANVFDEDSDGDGFTNGQELGDPNGEWTIGDPNPGNPDAITNPGDEEDAPTSIAGYLEIKDVFPNPFMDKINLEFEVLRTGSVGLDLFDLNGQLVQSFFQGDLSLGRHTMIFDVNALNRGTYLIRYTHGNRVSWLKIVK